MHNGESKIANRDGYLFYTADGVNYLLGYVGNDTNLILPDDYNGESYEIYTFAFYSCTKISGVVIPDNVTGIGEYAFYESGISSISYLGTEEQWNAVSKGTRWDECYDYEIEEYKKLDYTITYEE